MASSRDPRSTHFKELVHHTWNHWFPVAQATKYFVCANENSRISKGVGLHLLVTCEPIEDRTTRWDGSKLSQREQSDVKTLGQLIDEANRLLQQIKQTAAKFSGQPTGDTDRYTGQPIVELQIPDNSSIGELSQQLRQICEKANKLIYHRERCEFFEP